MSTTSSRHCGLIASPKRANTSRRWYVIAAILLPLRLLFANDFALAPGFAGGLVWNVSVDGAATSANPTLYLMRDRSYTFRLTGINGVHPFYINTVSGTGSSHAYVGGGLSDNGVSTDTPADAPVTFDVPQNAPDTLFYNCGNHSSMAGQIKIAIFRDSFD